MRGEAEIRVFVERIRNKNPYPEDVFIPIQQEELRKAMKLLSDGGVSPDAFAAHLMRISWLNCCNDFLSEWVLGDEE